MVLLDGSSLTLDRVVAVAHRGEPVALTDEARARVNASRAVVDRAARGTEPAYGSSGVNQGKLDCLPHQFRLRLPRRAVARRRPAWALSRCDAQLPSVKIRQSCG